ncbi:hypothetical protein GCM10011579_078520 [Streptomyces albiflavescens]|uniref:Uncharacterized protein n=1 Tax=Streptomyces albiflavescens TaxID=1623582 RepID=A0A917YCU0_9ACTN|nr:hypothetical protein GCM10011579_078520 [Streptomyces albiflavescens]
MGSEALSIHRKAATILRSLPLPAGNRQDIRAQRPPQHLGSRTPPPRFDPVDGAQDLASVLRTLDQGWQPSDERHLSHLRVPRSSFAQRRLYQLPDQLRVFWVALRAVEVSITQARA